jgi:hypothetical protein
MPLGSRGFFRFKIKNKSIMGYIPIRSGFTGPSAKIGGSTEYHQDLKLLQSLPVSERVKMLDAIAQQNQSIGREIEFSNPAVSGRRWNVNANLADKVDLLERAATAHGHSKNAGWQSLDYYTPFKGKTRFDKGAVEDASIYLPAVPGGRVTRGSGGGYGYFSESVDPGGRVIARVGHGNVDRPEAGNVSLPGSFSSVAPPAPILPGSATSTTQATTDTRTKDILEAFLYGVGAQKPKTPEPSLANKLVTGLMQSALAPQSSFLSKYIKQEPYIQGQEASTNDYLYGLL